MAVLAGGRWLWLAAALVFAWSPARADEMKTYVKRGMAYDDVKMDIETAIEGKGLKIGAVGDLGDMLARTQADIAKGPVIYKAAHYYQFCSAMLTHKLMAADPNNIGHCPFIMFSYETVSKPGEVVVGYRTVTRTGSAATRAVLDEVDAMFDAIARDAIK
jgi:uncharacterized protein (DUF302 family)